jgi:hypothetical protein
MLNGEADRVEVRPNWLPEHTCVQPALLELAGDGMSVLRRREARIPDSREAL